jgi:alpha-1,3-rhamnosyltransferase
MINNRPLVSIVIPAYNHENYIEEAIDSIMNQTYKNIELIVINDGSTDKTDNIIRNALKKYNNVFKYISKENEGLIKTLNYSLGLVSGKYFKLLASDDILLPEYLDKMVNYLEGKPDYGMVYSDSYIINEQGIVLGNSNAHNQFKEGNIFGDIFTSKFWIPALTVLIKMDVIMRYKYEDNYHIEDWLLWCKISYYYKVGLINEPLAKYRIHETNTYKRYEFMKKEQDKSLTFIKEYLNIENNLYIKSKNNLNFIRSKSNQFGILYAKRMFINSLYNSILGKMTLKITIKDYLKFLFKYWK